MGPVSALQSIEKKPARDTSGSWVTVPSPCYPTCQTTESGGEARAFSTVFARGGRFVSSPSTIYGLIAPSYPQAHGMEELFNGRIGEILPADALAPQGA